MFVVEGTCTDGTCEVPGETCKDGLCMCGNSSSCHGNISGGKCNADISSCECGTAPACNDFDGYRILKFCDDNNSQCVGSNFERNILCLNKNTYLWASP